MVLDVLPEPVSCHSLSLGILGTRAALSSPLGQPSQKRLLCCTGSNLEDEHQGMVQYYLPGYSLSWAKVSVPLSSPTIYGVRVSSANTMEMFVW